VGGQYAELNPYLRDFIESQHLFFVATAAQDGRVNVSPKGGAGTLRVVDEQTLAYLDLTGSGSETVAHLRAFNRITLMWCAFEGSPNIVRAYGSAQVVTRGDADWERWSAGFPQLPGARAVVVVTAELFTDACGMQVPFMDFVRERDDLTRWAISKGDEGLADYRERKNAESIDGLAAFVPGEY